MARRAKTKVRKAKAPRAIRLRATIEPTDSSPVYFVNLMEVGHTAHDFTIFGIRVPAKLSRAQLEVVSKDEPLVLPAEFQVIIPPTLVPGLISALTSQLAEYEKSTKGGQNK